MSGRYALKGKNRAAFRIAQYDRAEPLVIDPDPGLLDLRRLLPGFGLQLRWAEAWPLTRAAVSTLLRDPSPRPPFRPPQVPTRTAVLPAATVRLGRKQAHRRRERSCLLNNFRRAAELRLRLRHGIAVDADGNAYVTGVTLSRPTSPPPRAPIRAPWTAANAFVTKLNPCGTGLVYSTYLGGTGFDRGLNIAVDASGNAYVSGYANDTSFPITPGAFQSTNLSAGCSTSSCGDAFVTKLNPAGTTLVYSTYIGGSKALQGGVAIAVDPSGDAYIAGDTNATDFPTTPGALQTIFGGGGCFNDSACGDAFVTKLNSDGCGLVYSTYLGGSDLDFVTGIAVDATGNAYISGITASTNFPTTAGAFQTSNRAAANRCFCGDGFVTKLNSTGSGLIYSTLLGGNGGDIVTQIAIDENGNAYLAGDTSSNNFPVTTDAYQSSYGGGCSTSVATCLDAFVANLSADGTATALLNLSWRGTGAEGAAVPSPWILRAISTSPETTGCERLSDYTGDLPDRLRRHAESQRQYRSSASSNLPTPGAGSNMPVEVTTGNPVVPSRRLTFFTVSMSGLTTVTTRQHGSTPPPNYAYGSQPTQIDVNTTASFSGRSRALLQLRTCPISPTRP